MKNLNILKILVLLSVILFLSTKSAIACSCAGYDSVKEAYSSANAVIIGKVTKISNDGKDLGNGYRLGGQNVTVEIVKSFKNLKQKEITLLQPHTDCDWNFEAKDLNKSFLFYLYYDKASKSYRIGSCGRSAEIGKASDDLSWLNKLPQSLNKTRISGVIGLYESGLELKLINYLVGIKVKIYSQNKTYTVFTDKNGLYEVWGLPAGKYRVVPYFPKTYQIRLRMEGGSYKYDKVPDGSEKYPPFKAVIGKKCCAVFDFLMNKID